MPTDPERFSLIHKAAGLPKGDPTRRKILARLAGKTADWDYVWAKAKPKLTKAEDALKDTARYLESQGMSGEVNDLVEDALSMVGKALQGMKRTAATDDIFRQEHERRKEKAAEALGYLLKAQGILSDLTGPWRMHSRSLDQLIKTLR